MKKNEMWILSMESSINGRKTENNSVNIQVFSHEGTKKMKIPLAIHEGAVCNIQEQLKKSLGDFDVRCTTNFDSQMIRLQNSSHKILAKAHQDELAKEKQKLEDENSDLVDRVVEICSDYEVDAAEFDSESELPENIRKELPDDALFEIEDICETINSNNYRIMEIDELIDMSVENIKLEEEFCKYKPEVQSNLDNIIRSASFSALYTYFTAYIDSNDGECEYEYETKKIMQALSLAFCDIVNGKVNFTNTDECYQALKDMAYELYKAIPGEESKED